MTPEDRQDYEARIVYHEERARTLLLQARLAERADSVVWLTDAAKRHKRDAIRLQREGGSAKTP